MNISWKNCFLALLIAGYLSFAQADSHTPAFLEIQTQFPGGLKMVSKQKDAYFEFCPDNTCDLLVAKRPIPVSTLEDIGYLYLYYFSDYTELQEWRTRKQANLIARKIQRKPKYERCGTAENRKQALCVIQTGMADFKIVLYFVRYDEGGRHLQRMRLPVE